MPIKIKATDKTPEVHFDAESGKFVFKGISMPEDSVDFFRPLVAYANRYMKKPKPETEVTINLEYFNTSSSRMLYQFMKSLSEALNPTETKIIFNWIYEFDDADMEEAGREYQSLFENLDFKFIPVNNQMIMN